MTEREAAAYHEAGHAVMAYLRDVDFEIVTILQDGRYAWGICGCNFESSAPRDLRAEAQSYADTRRIEIGLAGPFAQGLYVGGFTPGREETETHTRAIDAHLRGSEDRAVQYALAGEVMHLNTSVGAKIMDNVIWSPSSQTILFDVSDHWHLVEGVATALIERDSLSQGQVHQIIQTRKTQRGPHARRINLRRYYIAVFTLIVVASAVVGLLVMPRTAAPVLFTIEPARPLPTFASPGAMPSGPTPAPEGAPPVPAASQTQTHNVLLAAQDEVTRSVLPDIPAKALNTIHGTVRVVVRVTVDSTGIVAGATLEPGGSPYFGRLAVEAGRRWQFAPAEGALPRNWILRFEITRTSTQVIPRRATD
jgi:TonB family protein